ncbi:MAG: D-hexose-6-phosphate mutarotase [Verrucomicrobiales bacterium]|nr:D-hexose-6-phosphate mutarotase [Verrucomicrobiales bacterium]
MEKIEGPGGIECYQITHDSGAEATIARHGGHLISWKTADGSEQLYLSPLADFAPDKAIRGGVPIIFPQFSDHGPFGRHGFARKSEWNPVPAENSFALVASMETRDEWPHDFDLKLGFDLGADKLTMSLTVKNPSDAPFEFHTAFHTYLWVDEAGATEVVGLEDRLFLNESTGKLETGPDAPISFGTEIDRAYFDVGDKAVSLIRGKSSVLAEAENFPDLVVWNPGPNHGIGDLPEDGWEKFVCIEAAQTETRRTLAPGQSWTGRQILTISSAP